MSNHLKFLVVLIGLISSSCSTGTSVFKDPIMISLLNRPKTKHQLWDYLALEKWAAASQNGKGNFSVGDSVLKISTNANSWDRSKIKTKSKFGAGIYSWKIYVPEIAAGEMCSIGAFLYHDDSHEIDFEIGYGKVEIREKLHTQPDELLVYMCSQDNPSISKIEKIKMNAWYNLKIELQLTPHDNYLVNWKINDITKATATLNYGRETKFNIFCSVENLEFMGDHIPHLQNYALFRSVEFRKNQGSPPSTLGFPLKLRIP